MMKKILIVDDSAFTRGIHKKILGDEGYDTVEAASGVEALEQFDREAPDLVIMDLLMPDMDGMEVIKEILEKHPDTRIVICSTDKQKARDGRSVETLGHYNPRTEPVVLDVDVEKARSWLAKGATPSETVRSLLKKAGVFEAPAES